MQTYWNTRFTKRDYECTNVVAIKADNLPKGYDPKVWKPNGYQVAETSGGLQRLCIEWSNGEQFEKWGYL